MHIRSCISSILVRSIVIVDVIIGAFIPLCKFGGDKTNFEVIYEPFINFVVIKFY